MVAIVDDGDYEWLSRWIWCALPGKKSHFYANRRECIDDRTYHVAMAREIMDAKPEQQVDHRNGNTLDNRRINLRICNAEQNARNRKRSRSNNWGFKGVSLYQSERWRAIRWRAVIDVSGKQVHLGYFATIEEAAHARDAAAIKYHGEFAVLNFKTPGYRWIGDQIESIADRTVKGRACGSLKGEVIP
jgi:hypothetical protein